MASSSFPPRLGALLADRYQLRELLGSGGIGQVFRAWDVQSQRLVAVKAFNPARCTPASWTAYVQVVTAANGARHPDLILPETLPATLTDTPLATTAPVAGDDLAKLRARTATIPWARALEIAERAAEILHAVYAATRVAHRDLKATNIIVTPENAIKLLDFGVAEFDEQSGDRTRVDTALGVVDYKAPEQLDSNVADDKTDQFSLAVIIYEMICGQRPFTGPSYFEVARKILFQPAQPLQDIVPDAKVPPALDALLQRALQKRPADRYPDLQTMQRAIAEVRRNNGKGLAATALRGSKPSKTAPPRPAADDDDVTTMQIQSGSRSTPNLLRSLAGQPARRATEPPEDATVVGPAPNADRTVAFADMDQISRQASMDGPGPKIPRTVIDLEPRKSPKTGGGGGERTLILGDDGTPHAPAEGTLILGDDSQPRPAEGTLMIPEGDLTATTPNNGGTMIIEGQKLAPARWTLQKTLIVINVACGILILIGLVVLVLSGGEPPPPTK
jgi:serine/threonine protein kinase